MAAKWIAQEPARQEWDERRGTHWQVDVQDDAGELVCVVFAGTERAAISRAARVERRAT